MYAVLGNTTFRIWELNVAVTTSQRVSTVTHLFALQLKYICECENGTKIFLKSNLNYYLDLKDPAIIFRNSCQISSFPPFFYAKFNLIGLNEGKSAFNLYNIKKSLLFFLNFHSVDCWLKVLYNISWNENYNFQCNFRNILAPKIVSRRLPIEYYCLASFLIQDQISAQATQKILTKNGRWTCFETCHFRINVHNRYVYLHIWKYIFLELADWQI